MKSRTTFRNPPSPTPRRRILVVDDDQSVRNSLASVLEGENYQVLTAANGNEALQTVARTNPDLVILDLNMPSRNGWDTFEQMSRDHPLVPVVIATARSNQLFTAMSAGVGALLEKPLDIPELLETIRRLLAEPGTKHLARLAGHATDLYYSPPSENDPAAAR